MARMIVIFMLIFMCTSCALLDTGGVSDPDGGTHIGSQNLNSPAWEWLAILGVAGVAFSMLLFFLDKIRIAIGGIASCTTLTVVSLGVMMFSWWIAMVGGIVIMGCMLAVMVPVYTALKRTIITAQGEQVQGKITKKLIKAVKGKTECLIK